MLNAKWSLWPSFYCNIKTKQSFFWIYHNQLEIQFQQGKVYKSRAFKTRVQERIAALPLGVFVKIKKNYPKSAPNITIGPYVTINLLDFGKLCLGCLTKFIGPGGLSGIALLATLAKCSAHRTVLLKCWISAYISVVSTVLGVDTKLRPWSRWNLQPFSSLEKSRSFSPVV